ncbi:MAG: hypothetical protein AAF226_03010 [Verrucomicrobiota bacterium]
MSKSEAQDYVGGAKELARLESDYGLMPFNNNQTHKLYRIASLDEAMRESEENERLRRYQRA